MYIPHLLYSFMVDRHLGCPRVLAIVNSAAMNVGIHVSIILDYSFAWIYAQEWDCWIIWQLYF